jgi:DNA repair ATPase RecN
MRVLLFTAIFGFAAASAVQTQDKLNPITRVAELLEGLAKKIAEDGKTEQDLYDKFKCWCTKVINAKATSIDTNEGRIKELAAYIDDLSSGRIELTSERSTLEEEIKSLEKAIEEEETMRDKEHEDFLAAEDEMKKAVARWRRRRRPWATPRRTTWGSAPCTRSSRRSCRPARASLARTRSRTSAGS